MDGRCHVSDGIFLVIGVLAPIVRLHMLAFAYTPGLVFAASALGLPVIFILTAAKSSITKMIDDTDVGTVFSLITCFQTALGGLIQDSA